MATKIEWTDETWNPVTGCSKVSQGCKYCYAERIFSRPYPGRKFTDVRTHPERLTQPLSWRTPKRVFVNSMSDLFHEAVPDSFIGDVFDVMFRASHHTFQVLTKRPEQMLRWFDYWYEMQKPSQNVWLGVSVENQEAADERIPLLLQTPAAVRFLSVEPLLEEVDLIKACWGEGKPRPSLEMQARQTRDPLSALDWIIVGGESGPGARPCHLDWIRRIVEQCKAANVPCFVKQLSQADTKEFKDFSKFPVELRVREFPQPTT